MPAHEYYHNWNLRNRDLAKTLENYLIRGFPPGGFTTAVLAGDLFVAVSKADHWNKPAIPEITQAVMQNCPQDALGSYEAVDLWCRDYGGRRQKYVTWKLLQGPVEQKIDEEVPF